MIAKAFQKNKCLTEVLLFDTDIKDEAAKELCEALQKNKSLTHVNLGWNSFSPKYLSQINKLSNDNIAKAREDQCPIQQ